ncbi:MAG: tetratricopeptide repeat protein, partial [Spirochaetota bacterium]|nr:tetratricopeptide repeat protein [Spirochaetota bacterium]
MININISNHKILSSGALSISVIFLALATWLFTHPKPLSAKPTWNDPEAVWSKILVSQNDAAVKLLTGYLKTDPNSYRGNELAVMLYEMRADRKKTLYHLLRLLSHDHPLNYLYVRKAQSLLTDYNDVWIFAVALESLLKKSQRPRIKSVIRHTLMDLYARLGRWNRVYQLKKKLGWLTEWSIVGPFNNDRQSGFDRAYGPENEILYGKGYRGRLDKLGFRKLVHSNHDGSLPMDSYIYPDNGVVAYGLCYIHSSYARTAYIYAGSTDSLKLWVNDNLALSHRKRKIYAADQYRVKLSLRAGWNKLLWKSARGNKDKGESGDWRVALRLVDADDNPLRGIRITHDIRTNRRYGAIRGGAGQAEMPYQFAIPQTLTSYLSGLPSERRAFYLAMWYRQHQFKEEAVNELEKLRDKWSQNSHYLAILGESYHANDDRGKGQKALKEAIGLDDANFLAHIGLGEYYFRQSMYEKSYASFHKLYKRVGLDIDVYPRLMALYKRKSWDYDALLMAQRAIRQHKTNYLAQLYLANIHRKLGNTREAIIRYQKAIRLNLTHQSARLRLMNLYESKDMDRQAIGQLMALIGLSPAKISYRLGLARLYVKRKRYKLAIKSLSEAAKISPDHPEILKATGDLYYRMGRKSLSLKYYRQALRYAPWDQELREYIHFLSPETVSFMERYAINANEIKDILRKAPPISAHP